MLSIGMSANVGPQNNGDAPGYESLNHDISETQNEGASEAAVHGYVSINAGHPHNVIPSQYHAPMFYSGQCMFPYSPPQLVYASPPGFMQMTHPRVPRQQFIHQPPEQPLHDPIQSNWAAPYYSPWYPGYPPAACTGIRPPIPRSEHCGEMRTLPSNSGVPSSSLTYDHSASSGQSAEHYRLLHSQSTPVLRDTNLTEDEFKPPLQSLQSTIEVHGHDIVSSEMDKYWYFFENQRRGGGAIEAFELTEDNILLITFKDHSVAQNLAEKGSAMVGKIQVTIKQHFPPPLYKNEVLLEYKDAHLDKSNAALYYYIEARSSVQLTNIETGTKKDVLLLTFVGLVDVQTLQAECRKRPFRNKQISVRGAPATNCVHVQGIPDSVSTDTIENYFENRKSGNDTDTEVTRVEVMNEDSCLVYFADFDVGKFIRVNHTLENHPLKVRLFHKCIECTPQEDVPLPRTGAPAKICLGHDQVNPLIVRWLKKSQPLMPQLIRTMRDHNIELCISEEDELCVLSEDAAAEFDRKRRKQIQTYACSILHENVSHYSLTFPVDMKYKIESTVRQFGFDQNEAKAYIDTGVGKIAIVGWTEKATEMKIKLERYLQMTTVSTPIPVVTEQTTVVEQQTSVKPLAAGFLSAMNFEKDVKIAHQEVTVKIDLKANEVRFEGPEDKVTDAKLHMLQLVNSAETFVVQTISEQQIALLQKTTVAKEITSCLRENGMVAGWNAKQSSLEVMATSKSAAEKAGKAILASVIERIFQLENCMLTLLSSESWHSLYNHLADVFPDRFIIANVQDKNYLLIVGLNDSVDNVYEAMRDFFAGNTVENTVVDLPKGIYRFLKTHLGKEVETIAKDLKPFHVQISYKDDGHKLTVHGSEEGIKECKHRLKQLISRVKDHNEPLEKAGMAKMMTSEKGARMIYHIEKLERCTIEVGNNARQDVLLDSTIKADPAATIVAVTNLSGGRKIYVREGDITSFQVRALVNAANSRLDHCGGLAKTIVDRGGSTIQDECTKYVMSHGELLEGGAVLSGPGKLQCDVVIHTVGPNWKDGYHKEKEYLTEAVLISMELAESKQCVSIAIPGLSTGIFGYPTHLATNVITTTVRDYFRDNKDSVIKDVYFCDNHSGTIKCFVNAMKAVFGEANMHILPQQESQTRSGPAQRASACQKSGASQPQSGRDIVLVTGQIARQKVDIIVNTTSQSLELKEAGSVSKSLSEVAGSRLQSECRQHHPGGITPGSIAVTRGGKLQCKRVYHVFLPPCSSPQQAEKEVRGIVMKCLVSAAPHGVTSISFPALGTGGNKYPRELVADCMLRTIYDYWANNPTSSLKDVRIVLYDKDQPTITAFEEQKKKYGTDGGDRQTTVSGRFLKKPDLLRGSITRFKADVIVNPTDHELNLTRGKLSKSIAEAAGPTVSTECRQKYPNGVPHRGLAVTSAGLLNASEIYHVVVMNRRQVHAFQHLTNAVTTCLEEANRSKHTSILFPTLGIGTPDYAKDVAAQAMYEAIDTFWVNNPGTTLTQIKIVIYDKDHDVAKVFEKERNIYYQTPGRVNANTRKNKKFKGCGPSPPEEPSYDVSDGVTFGNIQFKLIHGDLLREQVDCIVNNVRSNFDLNYGLVNQALLQKYGNQIPNKDPGKVTGLNKNKIAITEVRGAPFSKIIHYEGFSFDHNVENILKKCLNEADKMGCSSLALPALGQGPRGGIPDYRFFQNLYETLIGLPPPTSLVEVHLVIIEQPMYERFTTLLENFVDIRGLKKKKILQKAKEAIGSKDPTLKQQPLGNRPRFVSEHGRDIVQEVSFFSDIQQAIDNAKQKLFDAYDKKFDNQVTEIEALNTLDDNKIQRLVTEAKQHGVVIELNRRIGRAQVQGIKDDVTAMVQRIYQICLEQKEEETAEILGSAVQWYCMDMLEDDELIEYDPKINKAIEKAFRGNKETHELEDEDGVKYVIHFGDMEEYREDDHTSRCPLIRKDLMQAAEFDPPSTWEDMGTNNMKVFRVNPSSTEYGRVAAKFASTNKLIVKIERIQNKTMLKQYQAKSQLFRQRAFALQNDRELWHGTATDAIHSINKDGFNRSYCGKNAVVYGNGVYFAVNPRYSTQDRYARPDVMGNKYIYLVDVLTGRFTQGKSGMRVPPPIDGSQTTDLYDSVVDDVNQPTMFVIFNDTQAYPKYLITFK